MVASFPGDASRVTLKPVCSRRQPATGKQRSGAMKEQIKATRLSELQHSRVPDWTLDLSTNIMYTNICAFRAGIIKNARRSNCSVDTQ